jgi:chromosome segregation ATPase
MRYCTNGQICKSPDCTDIYRICAGDSKVTTVCVEESSVTEWKRQLAEVHAARNDMNRLWTDANEKLSEAQAEIENLRDTCADVTELRAANEWQALEIERMRPVVEAANSIIDDWNDKYKQEYLWKTLLDYVAKVQK